MSRVVPTAHLRRFFPGLDELEVDGRTVADVVAQLERRWPGFAAYVVDERGALRQHVNVFVAGRPVRDRARLGDAVAPADTVWIFQALSGG